jgi:hypothetical protein
MDLIRDESAELPVHLLQLTTPLSTVHGSVPGHDPAAPGL